LGMLTAAMPNTAADNQPAIRVEIANAKGHSCPINKNTPTYWTARELIVTRQSDTSKAAREAMEIMMTAASLNDSNVTG
jgi:hypothetical protein